MLPRIDEEITFRKLEILLAFMEAGNLARAAEQLGVSTVSAQLHEIFQRGLPIDIRPLHPTDLLEPSVRVPRSDAWFRVADRLPDDPMLHQAMLAYASDFNLLRTSMLPHGLSFFQHNVQSASLDHAMWIHREFRIDDWLLYVTDSPSASNARGFCRGSIYTRDGRLVASVAQEGLVRVRAPREASSGT